MWTSVKKFAKATLTSDQTGGGSVFRHIHCTQKREMLFNFKSYSEYLGAELERRKSCNTQYSLRSMALQLGLSPTTLSGIIKGKKKISDQKSLGVALKLKLNPREEKYFQALVGYQNCQNESLKALLFVRLTSLNPLLQKEYEVSDDKFILLSEWYYLAILELTYLYPNTMTCETVGEAFELSLAESQSALDLLVSLNLLEQAGSSYVKTKTQFSFSSEIPNQSLRHFHRTMLRRAEMSLVRQSNKEKFVGSDTFPLNVEDLPAARQVIENCFNELIELSKRSKDRTHVYHAGIQLFQLSRKKRA